MNDSVKIATIEAATTLVIASGGDCEGPKQEAEDAAAKYLLKLFTDGE